MWRYWHRDTYIDMHIPGRLGLFFFFFRYVYRHAHTWASWTVHEFSLSLSLESLKLHMHIPWRLATVPTEDPAECWAWAAYPPPSCGFVLPGSCIPTHFHTNTHAHTKHINGYCFCAFVFLFLRTHTLHSTRARVHTTNIRSLAEHLVLGL